MAFGLRDHRDGGDVAVWRRERLAAIEPEQGLAWRSPLPVGAPSSHAGPIEAVLLEDDRPIGRQAPHAAIREHGGGDHSFWRGDLWFSTSDGSDPRHNGRRYEVAWPSAWPQRVERVARWGAVSACSVAGLLLLVLGGQRFAARRAWRRPPRLGRKLALLASSAILTLAAVEIALRLRYPFADNTWPNQFDPRCGFTFTPGATVRQTNLFDFCVEQRANSLGFLDREPRPAEPTVPRLVVLGDSFVEAVQVPIERKFHVQLEQRLAARGLPTHCVAFGMSGSGTSNVIPFYETFGRARPGDLVILLVVSNDFANNSPLLESLRHGWHPDHLPRLFFAPAGDRFVRLPIDVDWRQHRAPAPRPRPPDPGWIAWSRLYRWIEASRRWIRGERLRDYEARTLHHLERLRRDAAIAPLFAGWRYPDDPDIDAMTKVVEPPPVFQQALALTEHALAVLRDAVAADGGRLLVVATPGLAEPATATHGRTFVDGSWLGLLRAMCNRLDLPLLDLYEPFAAAGALRAAHFTRDMHWSERGHAEAAAAIDLHLLAHPELLRADGSTEGRR